MRSNTIERKWKAEDLPILREMAASSKSTQEMADHFGVNRNSIIGKCYREKIKLRFIPIHERKKRKSKKPKVIKPYKPPEPHTKRMFVDRILPGAPASKPIPADTVICRTTKKFPPRIDECPWIVGNPQALTCCGLKRRPGHIYCRQHCEVAYQLQKARHA